MNGPSPLLEVTGLRVDVPDFAARRLFGTTPARTLLSGVDMTVARGECLGLVGESGSGKTTLARTVLRLLDPAAGRIVFDGIDIGTLDETALRPLRARMQMIFQDPLSSLNPRRTIRATLAQPLEAAGRAVDAQKVDRLLERVGLPAAFGERYPHQLSGGQRQRVGIARALALEPQLIVADEILSGLDVSTQARILALLRDLRAAGGLTMIFVTHDLSVVRVLCDRVAVMRGGTIVETGTPEQLFAAPRHDYTRELIDAVPLPEVGRRWL